CRHAHTSSRRRMRFATRSIASNRAIAPHATDRGTCVPPPPLSTLFPPQHLAGLPLRIQTNTRRRRTHRPYPDFAGGAVTTEESVIRVTDVILVNGVAGADVVE